MKKKSSCLPCKEQTVRGYSNVGLLVIDEAARVPVHPLRRPLAYGRSGRDPVWYIAIDLLGGDLQFHQDSATHGLIEPARAMPIDALQRALQATKPHWKKVP